MRPRIGFAPVQDITRRANVCVHAANRARSCETPLITGFAAPASLWIIYFPRGLFYKRMWSPDVRPPIQPGAMGACCWAIHNESQVWRVQRKPPSIRTTRPIEKALDLAQRCEHSTWTPNMNEAMPGKRSQRAADQRHAWCPGAFHARWKVQEISYRSSFFQNVQYHLFSKKKLREA